MRLALTDRFVAAAKADGVSQADYFDEKTPGLALRVSEAGTKVWTFNFTSPKDGKRARLKVGSYPGTSLAGARTKAKEARGYLEEDPPRDPRDVLAAEEANAWTVQTLCEKYLEMHVRPAELASADNIEQRFRKNVLPVIGAKKLATLHQRDINAVLDPIIKRAKGTEANRVFEALRAMFRWAVKRGDLDRSPLGAMEKPAAENGPRERVLSNDEIRHMWDRLPTALPQSMACQRIIRLCLATAQRCGEVAGMRRDELDLGRKLWSLPGSRTKNASPHAIPLSDMALAIIKAALEDAGDDAEFVFPSPLVADDGRAMSGIDPHAVATTLRRAHAATDARPKGRFDMVPFCTHDLRRSALTGLAQLGVAPIVIGAVANHLSVTKSNVTFAHYVKHSYEAEKREALDLWAERLDGIIGGAAAKVLPMRKRRAAK
jgi:integrase